MGRVYAEIEIIPTEDLILARKGYLEEKLIRRAVVRFVVDSGADYLCINEHIKNQLQLPVLDERVFELADRAAPERPAVRRRRWAGSRRRRARPARPARRAARTRA